MGAIDTITAETSVSTRHVWLETAPCLNFILIVFFDPARVLSQSPIYYQEIMSQRFTPSQVVDMSKEKDWPLNLGMLDWDDTKVVFTKRTLLEFLRYTGTTVDTNFSNIQKLPRYATFGKMSDQGEAPPSSDAAPPAMSPSTAQRIMSEPEFGDDALSVAPPSESADGFKPTRRVRTVPGGSSSMSNIFSDEQEAFIPTRKVRERPGGADNIEGLF